MKKIINHISVALLIFTVISSCKKDNNGSTNKKNDDTKFYIKFKISGAQKELDYNPTTLFTSPLPIYAGALVGQFADNHTNGVNIGLNDSVAYKINKDYTQQIITFKGKTTVQGTITFKDEDGTIYYASGNVANTSFTLKFTELASDHVTGTFSGHLIKVGSSSPVVYSDITEGQFRLGRSL